MSTLYASIFNVKLTQLMIRAEHVTAVTVSVKDKLTLSLGVAVGSSIVSTPPVVIFCMTLILPFVANCPLRHSVSIA